MERIRSERREIIVTNPPKLNALNAALDEETGVVIIGEDESKYSFVPKSYDDGRGYTCYQGNYYEIRDDQYVRFGNAHLLMLNPRTEVGEAELHLLDSMDIGDKI